MGCGYPPAWNGQARLPYPFGVARAGAREAPLFRRTCVHCRTAVRAEGRHACRTAPLTPLAACDNLFPVDGAERFRRRFARPARAPDDDGPWLASRLSPLRLQKVRNRASVAGSLLAKLAKPSPRVALIAKLSLDLRDATEHGFAESTAAFRAMGAIAARFDTGKILPSSAKLVSARAPSIAMTLSSWGANATCQYLGTRASNC